MEVPPEVLVAIRGMMTALARVRPAHVKRLLAAARDVQVILERRMKGLASGRYTTQEVRGKLAQVRAAVEVLGVEYGRRIGLELEDIGRVASKIGRDGLLDQLRAWGPKFPGAARLLSDPEAASDALDATLLEYYRRSRETYGLEAISKMKGVLARSALEGRTVVETLEDLSKQLELPEWRAERIVRTEQTFAAHRRQILNVIDVHGDDAEEIFAKQLVATFDNRTGEDSKFVHGQVRRLMDEFQDNVGRKYQHPPNRPNDREVVVLVPLDKVEAELGAAESERAPDSEDAEVTPRASGAIGSKQSNVKLTWFEPKREKTLKERGLDFADATVVLESKLRMDVKSPRDGEERIVSFAVQDSGRVLALVHVLRGDEVRVISFRAASKSEQRKYREWLKTRE